MISYLGRNRHETVTRNSFKLMNSLQGKHYAKIDSEAGDAFFDDMIAFFDPYKQKWESKYNSWKSASDTSQGKTKEMLLLFHDLTTTQMPKWEVEIYSNYPEHSPKAQALLPNKRTPYISGAFFDRITALSTLITNIGSDALLAVLKVEITAFRDTILACFNQSQGMRKNIGELSKDLEPIRIEISQALLADEGLLINKFFTNPEKVDGYFDVHAMRKAAKKPADEGGLSIDLMPAEIKLLNITFTNTQQWAVSNLGTFNACIFFSDKNNITEVPDAGKYIIIPGETLTIDLGTIPPTFNYVYVANLSFDVEGEVNIEEIK